MKRMQIIMYILFKLKDTEIRYLISKREILGVVKALLEARKYILLSPYPTIVYTDYLNIISILGAEGNLTGKIAL